ncbi:MAG: biotin/lipoyl-containing protein [Christensenellales bacterium]
MATAVIMPRQGQSVESCVIGEWFKKVGDDVGEGELLFSYETDKAVLRRPQRYRGSCSPCFLAWATMCPALKR